MPLQNDVVKLIDLPHAFQEVVNFMPANSAAGTCMDDDGERYIYVLHSATSFWRYDTWHNTIQQLANPAGTFGAGTTMRFTKMIGTQLNQIQYGSIYLLLTSGTGAATFQKYDIATNTWATLNVTNLPATFGTDGSLIFLTPAINAFDPAGYHAGTLRTITTTAQANANATTIAVAALPEALASGTRLNFGTNAAPIWATLTAAAALNAVSVTVAPLVAMVPNASTAQYYGQMYLVGNAGTQMYRYNIGTAVWSTTSANTANPALAAIPGAVGAGNSIRWAPGITGYENKLVLIRGAATSSIYVYDLVANTWATLTYYPSTETFTTGNSTGVVTNPSTGKPDRILLSSSNFQNSNVRILEVKPTEQRMDMVTTLVLYPTSTAVVWDKMTVLWTQDGYQALYQILHTSNALIRDLSLSVL